MLGALRHSKKRRTYEKKVAESMKVHPLPYSRGSYRIGMSGQFWVWDKEGALIKTGHMRDLPR